MFTLEYCQPYEMCQKHRISFPCHTVSVFDQTKCKKQKKNVVGAVEL